MFKAIKGFVGKANKKATIAMMALMAMMISAIPAGAAPSTGNTDVDSILTEFETGFGVINKGFVYLAIAGIAVTLIVVAFFWIRGKFKQTVAGA